MHRTSLYIVVLAVYVAFGWTNASAQILSTARPFLHKADSISLLYAKDAGLVLLFSWDIDTTGNANSWEFKYVSRSSGTVYAIVRQNGQIAFNDSTPYWGTYNNIPATWIDSDSALSVAQKVIGSAILAQFPSFSIFAQLVAGIDSINPSIVWKIAYQNGGRWREADINAATGDTIRTFVTDVQPIEAKSLPTQFTLFQNYPNPFNPIMNIAFFIPHQAFVSLKIYDLSGKEVASIASALFPAGRYSREWNASNLASGFYLCRMQSDSYDQTKKLLLLK